MPGLDPVQLGLYAPMDAPWMTSVASTSLVANRAHFIRFVCPRSMTITKMSFAVNTAATADDQCDLGIYSADMATLLGSSGATSGKLNIASPSTPIVNLQTGVPLVQGTVYYAAFAQGSVGGTAAAVYMTNLVNGILGTLVGSTIGAVEQRFSSALFPLAVPVGGGGALQNAPVMALLQ